MIWYIVTVAYICVNGIFYKLLRNKIIFMLIIYDYEIIVIY